MTFNSWAFPPFFLLVYAVYRLLRGVRAQNSWLLASSLVFYALWDWRFLAPLIITGTVDYFVSRAMARVDGRSRRRPLLMISLAANLGFLFYFKYAGLFVASAASAAAWAGLGVGAPAFSAILPVGMSFYTFHALSYVIDVYRGEAAPVERLDDLLLFLAYFPQLISGPIARAKSLMPQLLSPRSVTGIDVDAGVSLVLWGFFKKLVVADGLASLTAFVAGHARDSAGLDLALGAAAIAAQVYCDFSGFIDIARGCSRLMGIRLQLNFERPLLARNPVEFWRRWNISLSQWLRDYVYIPLGGSREGAVKSTLNVMVVMAISGLWHGAAWHMVVWGLYEGVRIVAWRAVRTIFPPLADLKGPAALLSRLLNFATFAFGMIVFRLPALADAAAYMARLSLDSGPRTAVIAATLAFYAWPVLAWELVEEFGAPLAEAAALRTPVRSLAYGALLIATALFGARHSAPFIYYQF